MLLKTNAASRPSREEIPQGSNLDPGTPIEVVSAGTSTTNDPSGIDKAPPVVVPPPPGP